MTKLIKLSGEKKHEYKQQRARHRSYSNYHNIDSTSGFNNLNHFLLVLDKVDMSHRNSVRLRRQSFFVGFIKNRKN